MLGFFRSVKPVIVEVGPAAWFDVRNVSAAYTDGSGMVVRIGDQGIARLARMDLYDTADAMVSKLLTAKRSIE